MSSSSSSKASNLERMKLVMEQVYGKYESGGLWKPKPYEEGKGRYLWTDAFGVCNFATLYAETGEKKYLEMAERLIGEVHNVLGKDRQGKERLGNSTNDHPLRGGLRIGKLHPEGSPDGDGQYFHYLTKWMFALNRMSILCKKPKYNEWAIELVKSTHPHFVYNRDTFQPHMFWKMSIDLSRPAVFSEGNLDPYDGYITYRIIQQSSPDKNALKSEISDMEKMVRAKYSTYHSDDPLDLGEALWIAHWFPDEEWSKTLTQQSLSSLEMLWREGYFSVHERYRLGFREFGTTIGVQVNEASPITWEKRVEELHSFWYKNLFTRDSDITPVMYCTSLNPGVFSANYQRTSSQ